MARVIAVYVGQASQTNLQVGLANGIWGFKKSKPEYDQIQAGDVVLLASGYSGGSPRVKLDGWLQNRLDTIEVGVVTSTVFDDATPAWPDEANPDVSYPIRFTFDRRDPVGPVELGSGGPLGEAVAEALRLSAISQSQGYVLTDPPGFSLLVSGEGQATPPPPTSPEPVEQADTMTILTAFEEQLRRSGLRLRDDLPLRFLCGLMAKPFVILTGLSGSGKTQLAMALGRWLGEDRTHVAAVRPDWTGAEALFGYENLLLPQAPDGRAAWSVPAELGFMLRAADEPTEPYLLLLDEMNLAHVERYFADVLSGMESRAPVLPNLLQDDDGAWRVAADGPDRLPFPTNLLVVGTVNIDETTYQFSPKVLDRSTTIEFRVATESLVADPPQLAMIERADVGTRQALIDVDRPTDEASAELRKRLEDLHRMLSGHGREFGHRTFQEMLRFSALAIQARPDIADDTLLDYLVLQKVLPRIHGSARELSGVIASLDEFVRGTAGQDEAPSLPLSADKLRRMADELAATHFTAF